MTHVPKTKTKGVTFEHGDVEPDGDIFCSEIFNEIFDGMWENVESKPELEVKEGLAVSTSRHDISQKRPYGIYKTFVKCSLSFTKDC